MKKRYYVECFSEYYYSIKELEEDLINSYLHDNLIGYDYALSLLKRLKKYLFWLYDITKMKTYTDWDYERKSDLIFKLSSKIEDVMEETKIKKEELFNTIKYIIEPFYDNNNIIVYDENDDYIDELYIEDLPKFAKMLDEQPYTHEEIELCEDFCEKYYKYI
ncbi:MAG: hypothetical protein LUH05_04025 [Candidatus Gastranaerophilales bacterium]|nr:hypothetical protein [Candidatus Gastranaerophilales bacterium]